MSKIGMRPIKVTKAEVVINNPQSVKITSGNLVFEHSLPSMFSVTYDKGQLKVSPTDNAVVKDKKQKALWGLHRALLASKIKGAEEGFVSTVRIVGIGFKAQLQGNSLSMTLGYSHKIDVPLDKQVIVEIDKLGQLLTLKCVDSFRLGNFCATLRALRPPEPYKGTGIYVDEEKIIRKAGKSKS